MGVAREASERLRRLTALSPSLFHLLTHLPFNPFLKSTLDLVTQDI